MALILVVDDDPQLRLLVRKNLVSVGHRVVEAANGVNGLEQYMEFHPDIVVTDIIMPGKGGLALLTEIKKLKPDQKVLTISGGGKDGRLSFLNTAASIPGVMTLAKPFSREEFLGVISSMLEV